MVVAVVVDENGHCFHVDLIERFSHSKKAFDLSNDLIFLIDPWKNEQTIEFSISNQVYLLESYEYHFVFLDYWYKIDWSIH